MMSTQSESVDISSIKLAALRPIESLPPFNLQQGLSGDAHLQATKHACEQSVTGAVSRQWSAHFTEQTYTALHRPIPQLSQVDSMAQLASTVPDSQNASNSQRKAQPRISLQTPNAPQTQSRMTSPSASPHDTQQLSPSIYMSIMAKNKSAQQLGQTGNDREQPLTESVYDDNLPGHRTRQYLGQNVVATNRSMNTQATMDEGDDGHINLLSSYKPLLDGGETEDLEAREFSPTQSQTRLPQFPESQRFFKTPTTAGKKRDYNGDVIETPSLPRNPFCRPGTSTRGKVFGLSQAFAATQAASSPLLIETIHHAPSDRPSPSMCIQVNPVTSSSPLLPEANRSAKEPFARWGRVEESQKKRADRARSEPALSPGTDADDSEDDDFNKPSSLVRRMQRQRDKEAMIRQRLKDASSSNRARPTDVTAYCSSPIYKHQGLSPRPSPRGYGRKVKRLYMPGLVDDSDQNSPHTKKRDESEEETDLEEDAHVAVKRSSQAVSQEEEDKENAPLETVRIPETTARRHHATYERGQTQTSPTLRHKDDDDLECTYSSREQAAAEPFAILNSQPSQPRHNRIVANGTESSSSGQATDVILQSQPSLLSPCLNHNRPDVLNEQKRTSIAPLTASYAVKGAAGDDPEAAFSRLYTTRSTNSEANGHDLQHDQPPNLSLKRGYNGVASSRAGSLLMSKSNIIQGTSSAQLNGCVGTTTGSETPFAPVPPADDFDIHSRFETAASHISNATTERPSSDRSHETNTTATTAAPKRSRLQEIAGGPSPDKSGTFSLQEMLATVQDSERNDIFGSQSPIRPGRKSKRRRIDTAGTLSESVNIATVPASPKSDRELRSTGSRQTTDLLNGLAPSMYAGDVTMVPADHDQSPAELLVRTSLPTKSIRAKSTRRSESIWELQGSPPEANNARMARTTTLEVDETAQIYSISTGMSKPQQGGGSTPATIDMTETLDLGLPGIQGLPSVLTKGLESSNVTPLGEIVAPNQVWACFNGKTRAYYPARCLGVSGADALTYQVQWDGYAPDEIDAHGVRSLDLRIGDMVKVNLNGFPKFSHSIRGFKDKVASEAANSDITDVRGHKSLLVAPKQRKSLPAEVDLDAVKEVPVASIYLDSNMWGQMKDRSFEYVPTELMQARPRYATPSDRPSTPTTPTSRSRRHAAIAVNSDPETDGIFANMAFAISYDDSSRKSAVADVVRNNGGLLLEQGFVDLLEVEDVVLKPRHKSLGFTVLLADRHSRKEKYMQALALNLPCLSGKWAEVCVSKGELVNWQPYLLPAGDSLLLDGAARSRILPSLSCTVSRLKDVIGARPRMLSNASVIIVMGRGKAEEKRKPYLFLAKALGASRIEQAADLRAVKDLLERDAFTYILVEDRDVRLARATIGSWVKGDGPKVMGNEFIVQSLVLGELYEE